MRACAERRTSRVGVAAIEIARGARGETAPNGRSCRRAPLPAATGTRTNGATAGGGSAPVSIIAALSSIEVAAATVAAGNRCSLAA